MREAINKGTGSKQEMINQCKTLFEKTTQLMIASERSVGKKHYKKSYPFSPKLNEAATRVIKSEKESE